MVQIGKLLGPFRHASWSGFWRNDTTAEEFNTCSALFSWHQPVHIGATHDRLVVLLIISRVGLHQILKFLKYIYVEE